MATDNELLTSIDVTLKKLWKLEKSKQGQGDLDKQASTQE